MKSLSFYEQQHFQKLLQQEGQIKYLFDDFVRRVSPLLSKWSNHGGDHVWVKNLRVENAIDKELSELHSSLLGFITDSTIQSWNRGNRKADDLVKGYIEGMSVSEALREMMFARNADALNALLRRKDNNGFTVSDRVWKVADGLKDNLEYYLSSGVSAGRPATLIGQDVRQLLNEPDRRFRRVRDEEGKLVMSKPMADYHPGQGVYRSAYKNALRLTATQTNIGYRQADHDRWQKMDFVLGIEIKRSNNHKGPCKICDAMVGKYPKGFVFTGFHPFCICYATPIMMNHEEFASFLLDEKIPEGKIITSLPAGAEKFIRDNEEQLSMTKPYWYKDNFIGENKMRVLVFGSNKKEKRIKTDEEKADIQKRWNIRSNLRKLQNAQTEARRFNINTASVDSLERMLLSGKNIPNTIVQTSLKSLQEKIEYGATDIFGEWNIADEIRALSDDKYIAFLKYLERYREIQDSNDYLQPGYGRDKAINELRKLWEQKGEESFKPLTRIHYWITSQKTVISETERKQIWMHKDGGYIRTSNSFKINGCLRNKTKYDRSSGESWIPDDDITMQYLDKVISKNRMPVNTTVYRMVDEDWLAKQVGTEYFKTLEEFLNAVKKVNNTIISDGGYISTSCIDNLFHRRPIKLQIRVRKGMPCYISTNDIESEIIFGRDSKLYITKIDTKESGITIECEISQ